jgi:uncharacterized protein
MPSTYKTPGVYIEEISKFPPSIAEVATAIPAFIGYTEKALTQNGISLTNKPTRITSLLEYRTFFGGPQKETNLRVTVTQTTDPNNPNAITKEDIAVDFSGQQSRHNLYYALQAYFANGGGPCYIVSVGNYKNVGDPLVYDELKAGLDALEQEDEPTLIVFPEGQNVDEAQYYTLQNDALAQCNKLQDRFSIMDLHDAATSLVASGDVNTATTAFRNGITSPNVKYGACYFPNLKMTFGYEADAVNIVKNTNSTGSNTTLAAESNTALGARVRAAISRFSIVLPPSPVIAGVYAAVDSSRGVWKAPANVGLNAVSALTFKVTDSIQEDLNVDVNNGKSINAIRAFTGKGILVWGSRTLAGNDNEWRYVPVRRFFNMVEESVKKATGQFVFEPNDANTWVKVKAMIENFLTLQWRAGALAGAKPEQAFYVKVGLNETMTALDILEGRMIVEIGMAVVRPAEFIILKFSHKMQES